MRNVLMWSLTALAVAVAIPAQLLMFLAEKLGDWADDYDDSTGE